MLGHIFGVALLHWWFEDVGEYVISYSIKPTRNVKNKCSFH